MEPFLPIYETRNVHYVNEPQAILNDNVQVCPGNDQMVILKEQR